MTRKPFHFKQFSIYHDKCAMKIGTDGVLLGAWTPLNNAIRILDIGTGTGVIAIMISQRSQSKAIIDAIEIDKDAYYQATENINNCTWKNQLTAHHTSLQNFSKETSHQYDLIVSNPPFFIKGSKPSSIDRINARHTDTLSHEELIDCSNHLLSATGILSIVLPLEEGNEFIKLAEIAGLFCQRLVEVKPKIDKSVERLLLTFSKSKPSHFAPESLTIQFEKRNDYTPDYIALTKAFYTIM